MRRGRRKRAGFTLMEVAIAAVLVAILAAATIPALNEFIRGREAVSTANTLAQIATGINAFKTGVQTGGAGTNTYPRFISYLTNAISATQKNSCYANFGTATAVSTWGASGPFVTFNIPPGGLNTPLGVVQDSMFRNPNSATVGTLAIRMIIDSVDALRLDQIVDGGDGPNAGTLRATFSGTGNAARTAEVQYLVPVAAKC